jgi:lysine-N-methylase
MPSILESGADVAHSGSVRQPNSFDRFRCTGADCEDTCCAGWGISVDRETYEKYRNLPEHRIAGRPLNSLVEINPAGSSTGDFARLRLEEARCPALQDKLCAIQQTLGESYLPDLCRKYPRVLNLVGGAVERSLHLSCPEAARLVLAAPDGMVFHEVAFHGFGEAQAQHRSGSLNWIADDPDHHLYQVRMLLIHLIQERSRPLWQRIVALGFAVEKLAGIPPGGAISVLEDVLGGFRQGFYDGIFAAMEADSKFQLETVLELVVARIGSDYTAPRFLECYRDLMLGLNWTPHTTMEQLADRYRLASRGFFQPFIGRHQHLFENYLINYIFRTVFPYRSRLPDRTGAIEAGRESLRHSFVLLAVHYVILRTVLIGMAARYQDTLSLGHVLKLVQSYSKAFLHSTAFEAAAMEYLEKNLGDPARSLENLVME